MINNHSATAEIYLYGAHITSFKPKGEHDLLWLSEDVKFIVGKSIRGGVPLCWPWFGPHLSDSSKGPHGFARHLPWTLVSIESSSDKTVVNFELTSDEQTLGLWNHHFKATVKITVSQSLTVEFTTENLGDTDMSISEALHTYFNIGSVDQVQIEGLDQVVYLDKVAGQEGEKVQAGDIDITSETDRVYINTNDTCLIKDSALNRTIEVSKTGGMSTVVWNPWIDKAASMPDVANDGYKTMVCVETANAFDNIVTV